MYTVTLLTNPKTPMLDRSTVESLRNAWGGGDARWLNPGVAAEFPVASVPANQWEVWQGLQALQIDMAVQPESNRRKRLLIADMDSTMIQQECIDELADEAGVGAHVAGITARAMNGELDFADALRERVTLLKGLPETVIANVLRDRITLMPGGPALLATMRANGKEAKLQALHQIAVRLGLTQADAIAVGDGANDLPMLQAAGTGVALHAKPRVQADCDIRVNHGDLTALLYLQGYNRDAFAPC